ncbi:hypothetical protein RhiirA5_359503 [Rhizophagus irregularis]|uniref:MATA-HMG n=4 Tax=Rhizophagus irregularis TaxID=588596 RepID=A0A1B1EWH1_9GLOM|nr:hypothetical protein GLOIN_2v1669415 [Rhizophagus irregularis DAOM 181602=DAOM 197198]ANQ33156.1 MATA-HMG [Rhizophagus irregularis]EXX71038.1 hypothetical protein RirG_082090 [Rhizophagus irregularis DAOM 197198w]ANQ33157.1 MATA-HMG [Rhizophagus irregularis]ANQ33158.1 MATA-HMG [Rhizophagus irregularis]ANQ33160.1 MATA-HMG [Rhizophagus irregularis]|eukprot:XP_025171978.1 hypothetical protein GLOIN_2v1669415 [Rhizophagus irregularis DAOM 181602=DAOM 197198]
MIGHSTSRACVFINSNNPSLPSQLINSPTPLIRPPFPPTIDPHDLISPVNTSKDSKDDLSQKKLRTRAPNAFIIYRKVFIETARSQGYYLPMTVISSMASQSWEKENEVVKSEYRRLAREAFNIHCEMLPKSFSPRRRKREKWNIISFDDQDNNNNNNNNNNFMRTKKEELPGLFSWNSRSTTEPCIEHVTFTNPMLSSSNLCSSGLSGSPELSNNILLKEHYNPALKLPPLIPSNNKNHAMHTSLPKLFKPVISSKIRLLLNDDDDE